MASFTIDNALFCGPVALNVADLNRSRRFYEGLLGLTVREQSGDTLLLGTPARTLLELHQQPGARPKPRNATGLYHAAILLPSRADLAQVLARLISVRYRIGASDHLVSEALYLDDPDGNGLEIYRDRPRSEWRYQRDGRIEMNTLPLDGEGILAERGDPAHWHGMPEATTIGHVHLQVADLASTQAFYVDLLGLALMTTYPGALFVAAGGYHHHLGLNIWESANGQPAPAGSAGLRSYTLVLPTPGALDALQQRLAAAGHHSAPSDGALMITDPSGNALRLVAA